MSAHETTPAPGQRDEGQGISVGRGSVVDYTASDGQRHRTTLAELGRVLREGAAQAESAGRLDQTVLAGRHRLPSVDRPDLLVDDCRALGVPDPDSNGAVGALFIAACKAGVIPARRLGAVPPPVPPRLLAAPVGRRCGRVTATLQAAHAFAAHGWPVIPVAVVIDGRCMCGWPADRCTSPGKHPLNPGGCRNASVDPDTITGWWRRWPHANVGIATGRGSGIAVLDIDGNPGRDALARLEAAHGPLPGTVTATTGRGCHLYYKWPAGLGLGSGQYGRGLDHRGEGGYVLAPPSSHPSGHMYQWLAADDNDPTPWAHDLTDWPVQALPVERPRAERPVVVPLHRDPVEPAGILAGLVRTVLEAPVGQRNHTLNWAAYRAGEHIRAGRLNQVQAVTALQLAGERAGLTVTESRATIASGLRAGAA